MKSIPDICEEIRHESRLFFDAFAQDRGTPKQDEELLKLAALEHRTVEEQRNEALAARKVEFLAQVNQDLNGLLTLFLGLLPSAHEQPTDAITKDLLDQIASDIKDIKNLVEKTVQTKPATSSKDTQSSARDMAFLGELESILSPAQYNTSPGQYL